MQVFSATSSSRLVIHSFASSDLMLIPSNVVIIFIFMFFISRGFFHGFFPFFKFSLSSFVLPLSFFNIVITSGLNSVSVRLLVSILFSYFSGALFCLFWGDMFLCLLILTDSLCLFLCIR